MTYYSGANGDFWIAGTSVARVQKWAFNTTVALLDTTSLGDTDATSVYGIRNTAGSCSLFYWQDNQAQGDCSKLIRNIVQGRTGSSTTVPGKATAPQSTSLRLRLIDGSTDGRFIRGEVLLTSATMTMAQGDVFSADITFQFLGAPVEATL
tara:strand:- start:494 stop:946 length:453 start_codon:yes stop_codon:yes gene_type:complete